MILEGKESKSKKQSKSRPSSPPRRSRSSKLTPPSASLVDGESAVSGLFEDSSSNPRSFPYNIKQQCWEKAEKVKGRDPDRWRRDAVGNIVFRKLVGCPGCLCHDYDHIIPYSKGGKSTLENCQVLQATVNRSKGNKTELSKADLIQKSSYCRVEGRDMDLIELSAYGNVHHAADSGVPQNSYSYGENDFAFLVEKAHKQNESYCIQVKYANSSASCFDSIGE